MQRTCVVLGTTANPVFLRRYCAAIVTTYAILISLFTCLVIMRSLDRQLNENRVLPRPDCSYRIHTPDTAINNDKFNRKSNRRRRRCIVVTFGHDLPTPWLLLPGNGSAVVSAMPAPLGRRRVAIFAGECEGETTWRLDDRATPENGIYRLDVVDGGGYTCTGRNSRRRSIHRRDSPAKNNSSCSVERFSTALARWRITDVRVLVDRKNFDPDIDDVISGRRASSFADLLRCYVAILEAIVASSGHRQTALFLHVVDTGSSSRHDTTARCMDPFSDAAVLGNYQDVLLSAIFAFTEVYETLYGLDLASIVLHRHG